MQYRLGIFGFLFLNDTLAPGNMGLLDQQLALKWIHDNIDQFGGDRDKITLMGQSAGASSVNFHLLSPGSLDLFRNAIIQSGTALSPWAILSDLNGLFRSKTVLNGLGCGGSPENIIECLNKYDSLTLVNKTSDYFYNRTGNALLTFEFAPVVDNYFILGRPLELFKQGRFKKCPIITGITRDETNTFFAYYFKEYLDFTQRPTLTYSKFLNYLTQMFKYYPQYESKPSYSQLSAIKYRYTHWENVNNEDENYSNLCNSITDYHFLCPTTQLASVVYNNDNENDVYLYEYAHQSSSSQWPKWFGAVHAEELEFIFGNLKNFTQEEEELSQKMMRYWSNFVKFNSPNDQKSSNQNEWPKYEIKNSTRNDTQRAYLKIQTGKNKVGYNLRVDYCAFWEELMPNLS
jgi:acetylcholinesterase